MWREDAELGVVASVAITIFAQGNAYKMVRTDVLAKKGK
jgi:hypothetical protein